MPKTPTTYCYVTDYLGSVRKTYRITGENEAVPLQHISYMPSGAVIKDSQPSLQKRRFTGKELITMHGWNMYDSDARFQYRAMPRFSSIDPMCEKYYSISPYAYCLNNPVRFVDPDGRKIQIPEYQDRSIVLSYINSISAYQFSIDDKGFLYNTGNTNENGKSNLYALRINDGIKNNELLISITIDQVFINNGSLIPLSTKGEGVTLKEDDKTLGVIISGKEHFTRDENYNVLIQSPADILMHELVGHALPKIAPSVEFDTGNAIDNENKIRTELQEPLRLKNENHVQ